MKLFLHWKSYPIIKMTKNYRQLLWYPHFERGWISAYWKICAYMQKTETHMRISAWNHIIHNRMPTSNLYVFVWLANVFAKLAKKYCFLQRFRLLSKPGLRLVLPINTCNDRRLVGHIPRVAVEAALQRWQRERYDRILIEYCSPG